MEEARRGSAETYRWQSIISVITQVQEGCSVAQPIPPYSKSLTICTTQASQANQVVAEDSQVSLAKVISPCLLAQHRSLTFASTKKFSSLRDRQAIPNSKCSKILISQDTRDTQAIQFAILTCPRPTRYKTWKASSKKNSLMPKWATERSEAIAD